MIFRLKLYQRYLMRETFAAVALVLVAFLVIFSFFELINELRDVGKHGQQMWHAIVFVVLGLPGLIYELIPIATLIGTLFALSTLARHSEITVLRASGLATRQLLMTLFRVALVLAVLTFAVGESLVPFAERITQAKQLPKACSRKSGSTNLIWRMRSSQSPKRAKLRLSQAMAGDLKGW